jgi:hypothetical protein
MYFVNAGVVMDETHDPLVFVKDGETFAKLCLDVTVYWRGSAFDRAAGIAHFYKRALKEIRKQLKYYETGTMSGAKPLRKDSLEMIPFWFQKAKRRSDIYMMNLESGENRNEPSDRAFFLLADEEDEEPLGAMKVSLPVSYADEADAYVTLVQELVEKLDFESGHAGYSLNWDPRGDTALEAQESMFFVATRFPGIDLFDLDVTLVSMRKTKPSGIKCVNWITLLGRGLLERVDGFKSLQQQLKDRATVIQMPGGVLIRAGEKPSVGDRNRRADLSAYRAVGTLLAPLRFVDHRRLFGSPAKVDEDVTEAWLGRFDR